jgi:hypothetical protein
MIENPGTGRTSRALPALAYATLLGVRRLGVRPFSGLRLCTCHPLPLGPPWLCSNPASSNLIKIKMIESGTASPDQQNRQMTLVKLHACQYLKVKRFPDIGQSTGIAERLRLRTAPPVDGWLLL